MMRLALCAALIVIASPLMVLAQNQTLEFTKLADGVYGAIYSEFRMDPVEGNSLVVVGSNGVLVLDSGHSPDTARRIIGEIRKVTDRPVRYLVNSHCDTLKRIRELDAEMIIPGHGPLMRDKTYLDLVIGSFESLLSQVTAARQAGLGLDETRKKIDVSSFRDRMCGDDNLRRAQFNDSILRVAVESAYKAAP